MTTSDITFVPIVKAKQNIEVDPSKFNDEVYAHIFAEGLKACLNARMTAITGLTKMSEKELVKAHADAFAKAQQNLEDLYAGNIKHSRAKGKSTIPAAVRAEAMRLAKTAIKDAVRAAGHAPSSISDKAYTAKAKEYIETNPAFIAQAKENIEARKTPQFDIGTLDIGSLEKAPPKLKKATTIPAGVLKPQVHAVHKSVN